LLGYKWIMLGLVLMNEIPHSGRRWPSWDDIDPHPIFPVQVAEAVALHSSDPHEKAITTDGAASGPMIKLDTRTMHPKCPWIREMMIRRFSHYIDIYKYC
jgi:hypothetical protein